MTIIPPACSGAKYISKQVSIKLQRRCHLRTFFPLPNFVVRLLVHPSSFRNHANKKVTKLPGIQSYLSLSSVKSEPGPFAGIEPATATRPVSLLPARVSLSTSLTRPAASEPTGFCVCTLPLAAASPPALRRRATRTVPGAARVRPACRLSHALTQLPSPILGCGAGK